MKRVNGYRDLDEYFRRILNRKNINRDILEDKKIIKQEFGGENAMFWFKYFGVNILYKQYDSEYNIYSELISEELAKYLGFKNAQYDLASFEGRKGLITYDFKKEKYKYVCIGDILDVYSAYLRFIAVEDESNTYKENYLKNYNITEREYIITNLYDIWQALEHYLKTKNVDESLIQSIVEKLMLQITDYFEFQIISGNYDMHSGNISIGFSEDYTDAEIAPLYDNEDMFQKSGKVSYRYFNVPRLMIDRNNIEDEYTTSDMLEEYLNISDSLFKEKFEEKLTKLDMNTIYELIKRVEEKIDMEIPYEIKSEIINTFNEHLNELFEIVENLEKNKKRS